MASSSVSLQQPETPKESKKNGSSKMLVMATVSMLMGCAFPAGLNFSVLNAPQNIVMSFCNRTIGIKHGHYLSTSELNLLWSFVVSIFIVGGMIGAAVSGWICNLLGRRKALLFNQVFGISGGMLLTLSKTAQSVEMIILGRLIVGYYSGFTFGAVPVYLTEISPIHLRGALGVVQQLGLCFGILIAQILGLKYILGTEEHWHILLGIFVIPILIFSISMYFCPESPKYLYIIKEKQDAALFELSRLRGVKSTQLEADVMELREEMKLHQMETKWSLIRLLVAPEVRLPLLLNIAMQAGQQLAGINAVFYYSTSIFISAGISEENSQYATIGTGVANATMASLALLLVSKFGRRKLFLSSLVATVTNLILITVALSLMKQIQWMSYVAVVALLAFVLFFGVGMGPIPYFIGAELFQQGPKPAAMSIGCWSNWLGNFIVGMSFPSLQVYIGEFSFIIFICFCLMLFAFVYKYLPETKDQDPVEVAKYFKHRVDVSRSNKNDICFEEYLKLYSIKEKDDFQCSTFV